MNSEISREFKNMFGDKLDSDVLMKTHTSFQTGGKAELFLFAESENDITKAVRLARKHNLDVLLMGNGSNLLVRDGGIRGLVVKIREKMNKLQIEGNIVKAEAGVLLSELANFALENELSGLEFAEGIPGTVGGAVFMNAGAYGGEMKDVVSEVKVLDSDLEYTTIDAKDMGFAYRKSRASVDNLIILSAEFKLKQGKFAEIKKAMDEYSSRRKEKQPLEYPSGGSTFKRPEGYYAAALLEESGLKGLKYKGAMVSEKHSGFIINYDNANSTEILELMDIVKKLVFDKFGVKLEPELRIVGHD